MTAIRYSRRRVQGAAAAVAASFEEYLTGAAYLNKTPYRWEKFNEPSGTTLTEYGSAAENSNWNSAPTFGATGVTGLRVSANTGTTTTTQYAEPIGTINRYMFNPTDTTGTLLLVVKAAAGAASASYPRYVNTESNGAPTPWDGLTVALFLTGGYPYMLISTRAVNGYRYRTWSAAGNLGDGLTHFLAFTQAADGYGFRLYLDGALVTPDSPDVTSGTPPSVDAWTSIWDSPTGTTSIIAADARAIGTAPMAGTFYHLSYLSNTVLSAADIAALDAFLP